MLHTCRCGEVWSADYIRTHMDQFELSGAFDIISCPDCGEDRMISGSQRHYPSIRAALEAVCH